MRGAIGRRLPNLSNYSITLGANQSPFLIQSSSSFSTGSGRGRGRGGEGSFFESEKIDFSGNPGKPADLDESKSDLIDSLPAGVGHGRGRGTPLPSDPILPSFSSFVSSVGTPTSGAGRGLSATHPAVSRPTTQTPPPPPPPLRKPVFVKKQDIDSETESAQSGEPILPSSVLSVLSGAGRGKPTREPSSTTPQIKHENRHIRRVERPKQEAEPDRGRPREPKLSREEAVKKAVSVLSRRDSDSGGGVEGRGRGMGVRGGGRGGRGRGRGRGRFTREDRAREEDLEEEEAESYFLGSNADGERLAKKVGSEVMNKLTEGFEEMSDRVLPTPLEDVYLDAMHTNFLIEFEPEYLMEEFGTNPDIDEKPPIPLRDALEKMKPFLMAYEGIQSQEEWEKAIDEVMERVPLLKEIVDHYSGPDRVTAKQQQQELERVAKTIPESAPASVKRFADRAVLSLQSNPGWGFDKKCQFMDKLAWEVSQHYK